MSSHDHTNIDPPSSAGASNIAPTRAARWASIDPKITTITTLSSAVITCLQIDNDKLVAAADDQTIRVYDMRTGALIRQLVGHNGGVWALQYVGNTVVSGSTDRTVRVWDLATGKTTHVFHGHTSTVRCLQLLLPVPGVSQGPPAGTVHVAGTGAKTAGYTVSGTYIADTPTPKLTEPLIVTGSRDQSLRVWRLPEPTDPVWPPTLVGEADDNKDEPQPAPLLTANPYARHTLTGHTGAIRALAGHGHIVCTASFDTTVRVWDVVEGKQLHELTGHTNKVYSVVYDGVSKCWSGSMDATVRCWDVHTGECLAVLEGHSSLVGLLELSPQWLVSASADASLRVWDLQGNSRVHVLKEHAGPVTSFQFDKDVAVSSGSSYEQKDGIKMWDMRTGGKVREFDFGMWAVWQVKVTDRYCVVMGTKQRGNTELVVMDFGPEVEAESLSA